MNSKLRKSGTILSICVLCAGVALSRAGEEDVQRRKLFDDYRAMEGDVTFFGKVVDQYAASVEGAIIKVSVPTPGHWLKPIMISREKTLTTDKDGLFEVSRKTYGVAQLKGCYLNIQSIVREGYEAQWNEWVNDKRTSFSYSATDAKRFVPDPSNPIVYTMRKKGAVAFLLQEIKIGFQVEMNQSGKSVGYDLIRHHRIKDTHKPVYNGELVFPDLQLKATLNTNDATWAVVLSPGDTNGGIIVSEQLLYEAPDNGYQPEYVFTPEDRKPLKAKYVYLKSRDPAIFTRLEIEHINANKEFFRLSGKSVTNPYGDRNLEQTTDIPYEVTKQLTDAAKVAFRQNKRPAKPDLPKLVKEAKEKAGKNKGKP